MATYGSGLGNLTRTASGMRANLGGPDGVRFQLDFEPSPQSMQLAFEGWAQLIDDWRPVWTDVLTLFLKHEKRSFDTQGESTGKKWAALSPAYLAWKKRHFPGRPILVLTGALRLALTERGPGWFQKSEKKDLEAGLDPNTPVGKIGEWHAFGTDTMPARPPVRYDETLVGIGSTKRGGEVPLGTAIAQLMQIHIVHARKKGFMKAGASYDPFGPEYNLLAKKRGVLNLATR